MAQAVVIEIGVDDKGTPVLRQVSGELKNLEDQTKGAGDASRGAAGANKDLAASGRQVNPAMLAASAGVAALVAAAAGAAVAIKRVADEINASVEAFREQDEVNRALERSLRSAGASGAPLQAQLDAIGESIGQMAVDTNFGDEELSRMASTFLRVSGAANVTEGDLEMIADIAAGMGTSGQQAAQLFSQAMTDQLPTSLAKVTSLTREQIAAINGLEDPAERAAAAHDALSEAFGGAATDINALFRASKNLEDAQGDLRQAIGQVVAEGGILEPFIERATDALRAMEGWVNDNREALQRMVLNGIIGAIDAVDALIEQIQRFTPLLILVVEVVQQSVNGFRILGDSIMALMSLAAAFRRAMLRGVVDTFRNILDAAISVAEFLRRDIPPSVISARDSLNDMSDDLADGVNEELEKAGERMGSIVERAQDNAQALDRMRERTAAFRETLDGARGAADGLRASFEESLSAVGQVADEVDRVATGTGSGSGSGAGASDEQEERDERERLEREHRDTLAQIRLAALLEEDERLSAIMENEADRREAQWAFSQEQMTQAELDLEMATLEIDLRQRLQQVDLESHQQRMQAFAAENQARERAAELENQRRMATMQANQEMLGGLNAGISGLGSLAVSLANVRDLTLDTAEGTQSMATALSAATTLGGNLAGAITQDRKQMARIEAGINAAAAAGAFGLWASTGFTAAPFGVAFANHTLAAAQFGAIGGGGGGATRASGASAGGGTRTIREAQQVQQAGSGAPSSVTIINDLSGATLLEDSQTTARRLTDATRSSDANRYLAGRGIGGRG